MDTCRAKYKDELSDIIRDNYPSKDTVEEPDFDIFSDGTVYSKDPNYWDRVRATALKIGAAVAETDRKIAQWDEENIPNRLWLRRIRLFLTNKAIIFGWKGDVFQDIKLTKLNLALLHLFLNHGGVLDKSDLRRAKKELQSIYTGLGREESEQLKDKEEDEFYRGNDWFSKLVTSFNRDGSFDAPERDWDRMPVHYGIRILTRNAKYDFERSKENDYELRIPYEVYRGLEALNPFKAELKLRMLKIERERELFNPIRRQRDEVRKAALQRANNGPKIDIAYRLGKALENKKPSDYEKWYMNDCLRRIVVSYDTDEYYLVQHGALTGIELPDQQMALILLFARHSDGLTLQEIRENEAILAELNDIYKRIRHNERKSFYIISDDESHPNAKLLDLIARIKKSGFEISKEGSDAGRYKILGIHELIEIPSK